MTRTAPLLALALLVAIACQPQFLARERINGNPERAEIERVARVNRAALEERYAEERPLLPNGGDRPKLCLALSGGGKRSASFAIGVMRALHETGLLDRMDVISGVSGGSYALSWYYMHQYIAWKDALRDRPDEVEAALAQKRDEMFDPDGDFQSKIERESGYLRQVEVIGSSVIAYLVRLPLWVTAKSLALVGTPDLPSTAGLWGRFYERSLRAPYQEPPGSGHGEIDVTFEEIGTFVRAQRRALPIIVATADVSRPRGDDRAWASKRLFELGVVHIGSDAYPPIRVGAPLRFPDGTVQSVFEKDFDEAPAISGAAVSTSIGWLSFFLDLVEVQLSVSVENPAAEHQRRFSLFPFYYLLESETYHDDSRNAVIRLSDGGFVDNLALLSPVRRLCDTIVVSDATQDGDRDFESFRQVETALVTDYGASVTLRDRDQLGAARPVLLGSVGTFPLVPPGPPDPAGRAVTSHDLKLVYVKPHVDCSSPGAETASLCGYAAKNPDFPHQSTLDQNFSREQVRAYRTLGCLLGLEAAKRVGGGFELARDPALVHCAPRDSGSGSS